MTHMNRIQTFLMIVMSTFALVIGFVLSEMNGDRHYMSLMLGLIVSLTALCFLPKRDDGLLSKVFSYGVVLSLFAVATFQACSASMVLSGGLGYAVLIEGITAMAIALVWYIGHYKVTVSGTLPVVGRFHLTS